MTASIAHEVNQPLAAIRTNAETGLRLLDRAEPDVTKTRELISRVIDDARRASDIVTRIRAMAAGRSPEPAMLALRDVIADLLAFLRHELQSKNVAISLDLAPALPEVMGDRTQLQQVVVNLTMNAVQAMVASDAKHRNVVI